MICDALERVERGETKRLMIFAPPRHTKSELASRRFPAWYLGRHPNHQIISATYAQDFADDFGRDVRDIVSSEEYRQLFDTKLREDSRAVQRWQTTAGGIYVTVGIGGPLTGRGANIALIDDPVKNREDADSEVKRETAWKWYSSTFRTRLQPGGAIVLMMTRWHEDDLAGRLLDAQPDRWEVVELKALSNDQALWPAWYPRSALKEIQEETSPRDWSALYQQNPTPDEGTLFKREHIKRFRLGEEPEHLHRYITTDFAVREADDADYTVFGDWGIDSQGEWWLLNVYRAQADPSVWTDVLVEWMKAAKPMVVLGEGGVIRRSVEPFLTHRMRTERAYASLQWLTRTKDKVAHAHSLRGMVEMGLIHVPLTDWGEELVTELLKFPAGEHDDQVDMCTLLGMAVDQGIVATVPKPEPKRAEIGYEVAEEDVDSFKVL